MCGRTAVAGGESDRQRQGWVLATTGFRNGNSVQQCAERCRGREKPNPAPWVGRGPWRCGWRRLVRHLFLPPRRTERVVSEPRELEVRRHYGRGRRCVP